MKIAKFETLIISGMVKRHLHYVHSLRILQQLFESCVLLLNDLHASH